RRQGRTLSAWPYATAFFRCLNGSRRISLTDLRFFAPALTKEEFHGNRLLWLAAVDKLIESFGEVCVLPLPSDAGHRLFPSVPFREGERRRQKTTLTEQKYSRQREREAERREREYQTCFAQAQIDLAFHTPATVGSWLSRWSGVVEEHDLETIFWGWCGRFP
ncbi:plasmid SOS inhibition protein A, partial [Escherichia coli]